MSDVQTHIDAGETEIDASKAPLMDHIIELRSRLIKAMAAFLIAFFVCFYFQPPDLQTFWPSLS